MSSSGAAISTSFVECPNWTVRTTMRAVRWLSNWFELRSFGGRLLAALPTRRHHILRLVWVAFINPPDMPAVIATEVIHVGVVTGVFQPATLLAGTLRAHDARLGIGCRGHGEQPKLSRTSVSGCRVGAMALQDKGHLTGKAALIRLLTRRALPHRVLRRGVTTRGLQNP
jgi:hypothetical protein